MYGQTWKGRFPAMVYGGILVLLFLFNCLAVVGVDSAMGFPCNSQEAAMEQLGDYPVLDQHSGYSQWGLRLYLLETEAGMELKAVEKHFLLDCYRVHSSGIVADGQRTSVRGRQAKVDMTITNGQIEGATLMSMAVCPIPHTGLAIPVTTFFLCLGLMVLELALALVFRKLRGN